jgi:hypothetical protein
MLEQIKRDENVSVLPSQWCQDDLLPDEIERIKKWLGIAETIAKDFECSAALDRIGIIRRRLAKGMQQRDLGTELRVLRETLVFRPGSS